MTNAYQSQLFTALSAGNNQTSSWIETSEVNYASFQINWTGLTGTLNGVFSVEVSNDQVNAVTKSSTSLTIITASGSDIISANGVVTERYYRAKWLKNGVSGGTLDCYAFFKD